MAAEPLTYIAEIRVQIDARNLAHAEEIADEVNDAIREIPAVHESFLDDVRPITT